MKWERVSRKGAKTQKGSEEGRVFDMLYRFDMNGKGRGMPIGRLAIRGMGMSFGLVALCAAGLEGESGDEEGE